MATDIPNSQVHTWSDGSTSTVTYSWSITSLKTRNEGTFTNAVIQTHWKCSATDEYERTGAFIGATPFTTNTMPDGDVFVPFDQLTEEVVIGWIKDVVVGHYATHITKQIWKEIDQQVVQVIEANLPWGTTIVPPEAV
jgi:hypothetical protein